MSKVSINLLCFGDHTDLARRCLGSVVEANDWDCIQDVRVGLNAVTRKTRDYVLDVLADLPVPAAVWVPERNAYKYPLMRRMFFDPGMPLAPLTLWMDDDSCLRPQDLSLRKLLQEMQSCDMLGKSYRYLGTLSPSQEAWVKQQSWNRNVPTPKPIWFLTGGFWVIHTKHLQVHDWPTLDLIHNGGDYMLGLLARHQGWRLKNLGSGFWVNADAAGRDSKAKRRGETSVHVGKVDLPDPTQHDFRCERIDTGRRPRSSGFIRLPE